MANQSAPVWDESFYAIHDMSSASTWPQGNGSVATNGMQFYIVQSTGVSGSNKVCAMCISSTGTGLTGAIGVLQNSPTSGHAAIVRLLGRTKVVASSSASISYGALITSSTWGGAVAVASSGDRVIGIARSASTSAKGQLIEVDLTGPFNYVIGG